MLFDKFGQEELTKKGTQSRDISPIWGEKTGKRRKAKICKFTPLINVVKTCKFHHYPLRHCGAMNRQSCHS
jgi:hypothetical protein